jgi:hypothetical protein
MYEAFDYLNGTKGKKSSCGYNLNLRACRDSPRLGISFAKVRFKFNAKDAKKYKDGNPK